jgi:hypothetical protein
MELEANRSHHKEAARLQNSKIRICLQVWFTEAQKKKPSETSMFTAEVAYETADG